MRTRLALLCVLVLFASPFFFAYLEAERLLVCTDGLTRGFRL
jgi:Tfp pilus assembly protein FimT